METMLTKHNSYWSEVPFSYSLRVVTSPVSPIALVNDTTAAEKTCLRRTRRRESGDA